VAIMDADKEGFLRSAWSLIQLIGRAARNTEGEVVMYADHVTESMRVAIDETNRRRAIQERYNIEHNISPVTIVKGIRDINDRLRAVAEAHGTYATGPGQEKKFTEMAREQLEKLVGQMEAEMRNAARNLEFERAAALRDEIQEIRLRVLDGDASAAVARAAEKAGRSKPAGSAAGSAAMDVAEVRVVEAGEEPGVELGDAADEGSASTASDWLPGIRDEHEDDGWAAKWLDRPTWDHTVTPNVIKRSGTRPSRRGGRRR